MFAKVFTQIFESTIAEDYRVRHVFMDLLVMADSDGVVDKTPESIARLANVPLEEVLYGINALCSPDAKSRTDVEDGRRLILLEPNRPWGWRIVNYQKYREIRDEEARRIANRTYKRMQRQREKESANVRLMSSTVSNVSTCQPMQREKQIQNQNLNTYTGGEVPYSSEKIAPLPKYTQNDHNEKHLRLIAAAEKKISQSLHASIGRDTTITEQEFVIIVCQEVGITVERYFELKEKQKKWPSQIAPVL